MPGGKSCAFPCVLQPFDSVSRNNAARCIEHSDGVDDAAGALELDCIDAEPVDSGSKLKMTIGISGIGLLISCWTAALCSSMRITTSGRLPLVDATVIDAVECPYARNASAKLDP